MRQKENSRMVRELHLIEEKLQEIGCKVNVISHPDLWKIMLPCGKAFLLEYSRGAWVLYPRYLAHQIPQIQKAILLALNKQWRKNNWNGKKTATAQNAIPKTSNT